MNINLNYEVDVDAWGWAQKFGVGPNKVEISVQAHLYGAVLHELRKLGLDNGHDQLLRTGALSAYEFTDDDAGYQEWLATHPAGYVINIARSRTAAQARVHHAGCRTISGENPAGGGWTGPYIKVCADDLAELDKWAINQVGEPISPCGTCRPAREPSSPNYLPGPDSEYEPAVPDEHSQIHGPSEDSAVIEAWADDYIRFERRPDWQEYLRRRIRNRCRELEPSDGQVLHAEFFGTKHPNADVENLVLYYIDSFRFPGRNGIRFEHGAAASAAPDGTQYPFCYRYALVPRSETFTHWQQGRTLASFDWTDLGALSGGKQAATVWQALTTGKAEVADAVAAPGTKFAIRAQVRPPFGRTPIWGGLVKGIFDGVVCAFQAHTDTTVLPEVLTRLAKDIPMRPEHIERSLLDKRQAVLGTVPRLVYPYRNGVKWDPADHLCVAGELLPAEPIDDRWAIKGDLVELHR
jgi:hypothetical protein